MKFNFYKYMDEAGADGAAAGGSGDKEAAGGGLMAEHKANNPPAEGAAPADAGKEENVGGVQYDAKPEWLDPQFYDEETGKVDIQAMQKSQRDFRNKTREGKDDEPVIPTEAKEYKFDHADSLNLDENDPLIAHAQESALKYGMSQEAYAGFMGDMMAKMGEINGTAEIDATAEKEKLGPNHERVIQDLSDQLDKMVDIGLFGEADYDAAVNLAATADGVVMLNKLFTHYQQRPGIPVKTAVPEGAMSKAELDSMVGTDEYNSDPAVRAKVKAGYERLYGQAQ
jgi:hypothetical protein